MISNRSQYLFLDADALPPRPWLLSHGHWLCGEADLFSFKNAPSPRHTFPVLSRLCLLSIVCYSRLIDEGKRMDQQ